MNRNKIQKAISSAVKDLKVQDLSDSDLGLDVIEDIVRKGEDLHAQALAALTGEPATAREKRTFLFKTMGKGKLAGWLKEKIGKRAKELICGPLYGQIDTAEERKQVVDKYDDIITDAIISAYPPLALARPLIKPVVRLILAQALAKAAKDLGGYCAVTA